MCGLSCFYEWPSQMSVSQSDRLAILIANKCMCVVFMFDPYLKITLKEFII